MNVLQYLEMDQTIQPKLQNYKITTPPFDIICVMVTNKPKLQKAAMVQHIKGTVMLQTHNGCITGSYLFDKGANPGRVFLALYFDAAADIDAPGMHLVNGGRNVFDRQSAS